MEERICRNLKYSLEQMKIAGEKDNYMKILDSLIVGPEIVRNVLYYSDIKIVTRPRQLGKLFTFYLLV